MNPIYCNNAIDIKTICCGGSSVSENEVRDGVKCCAWRDTPRTQADTGARDLNY